MITFDLALFLIFIYTVFYSAWGIITFVIVYIACKIFGLPKIETANSISFWIGVILCVIGFNTFYPTLGIFGKMNGKDMHQFVDDGLLRLLIFPLLSLLISTGISFYLKKMITREQSL